MRKELTTQLNVTSERNPDIRESVKGQNAIKLYWLNDNIELIKKNSLKLKDFSFSEYINE